MKSSVLLAALFIFGAPAVYAGPHHHGPFLPFELLDTNNDGSISNEEYSAAQTERFNTFDADDDGFISATEFSTGHERFIEVLKQKRFAKLDANSDGKLSAEEFNAKGNGLFERVDLNDDGSVSRKELKIQKAFRGR